LKSDLFFLFYFGAISQFKTILIFSMMGLAGDDGLIPRLCESLFSRIEENKGKNTSFKVTFHNFFWIPFIS